MTAQGIRSWWKKSLNKTPGEALPDPAKYSYEKQRSYCVTDALPAMALIVQTATSSRLFLNNKWTLSDVRKVKDLFRL